MGGSAALSRPARRRAFAIVFTVLLAAGVGNTALQSVLPAIGRSIHIPDILVGSIFSLSALVWAIATPFWARASDRHGRKPLIVLGSIGYAVSAVGLGAMVLIGLRHQMNPITVFIGMLLTRTIYGLFGSASSPASQAYVADHTEPSERTSAMALMASASGIGTIVGPALAPFFVLPLVGLAGPSFAISLFGIVLLLVVLRGLPGSSLPRPGGGPAASASSVALRWRDRRLAPFILFGFALASAQVMGGQVLGFLVIDTLHLSPVQAQPFIAGAMMAGAAATLSAQWGVIRFFHMSPKMLLRWGSGLAALGSLALAFAPNIVGLIAAYALASLGYGLARPGFSAGASLSVGAEEQGAVAGAIASITGASSILGPTVGLALYGAAHSLPFLVNAVVLIGLVLYASGHATLRRAGETA